MEVTVGANVAEQLKWKVGDAFASTHGLTQGGSAHDEQKFIVKGVIQRTNTVADNLIFTGIESIWHVHEGHSESEVMEVANKDSSFIPSPLIPSHPIGDSTKEVTSLLIQYRSPMAAIQLPRLINSQSSLQAASPAFETARLFSILGIGADILMSFAYVLILISALSIFIALYNSLKERRYDLAIMRSMGATRSKLFVSVLLEGTILTWLSSLIGIALAHGVVVLMVVMVEEAAKAGINGFVFYREEWIILAGSLLLGIICAIIPAWQAYRTDISKVLAGN
jgi:putative ABC transport system permease protein